MATKRDFCRSTSIILFFKIENTHVLNAARPLNESKC